MLTAQGIYIGLGLPVVLSVYVANLYTRHQSAGAFAAQKSCILAVGNVTFLHAEEA